MPPSPLTTQEHQDIAAVLAKKRTTVEKQLAASKKALELKDTRLPRFEAKKEKWEATQRAERAKNWAEYEATLRVVTGKPRLNARAYVARAVAQAKGRGKAPHRSMRFYEVYKYEGFLAACKQQYEVQLTFLRKMEAKLAATPVLAAPMRTRKAKPAAGDDGEAKKLPVQSLRQNSLYYDFCSGRTRKDKVKFFCDDHGHDNFMTAPGDLFTCMQAAARDLGKPLAWCDMCSDVLGGNSLLPYYLSARDDATTFDFGGWHVYANPPFKDLAAFIAQLEAVKKAAPATQALLVMPVSPGHDEKIRGMGLRGTFDMVHLYTTSTHKLFSQPGLANAFDQVRHTYTYLPSPIGVFVV